MFTITVYNEQNRTWTPSILFTNYGDAKQYLVGQGYREENRWFHRPTNGWYGTTKAIINPMQVYNPAIKEMA